MSTKLNTLNNPTTSVSDDGIFSGKNVFIVFLVVLLFLSFLGVNILSVSGDLFENSKEIIFPYIDKLFAMFGYSTGIFLNKAAESSTDAIKFSADIANGAVGSLSDLLITASKPKLQSEELDALDSTLTLNKPLCKNNPQPDKATSSTQKQKSGGKKNWCLVEEEDDMRQCVKVSDIDKCMSGQVFPSQKMCLNPNLST